ncbi:NUDIX domain protein [Tepidimonas alkaliphilus]|uniref:NUDIX domain protein n=1 Tax=Tepidimonas alkaliphilus TaxID=2588942 RepID=A0A554WBU0_9BURK|nr:NUDIX domain-containing protein [Tepidimonas alkaliphilus]TSE21039.1 NUDIX domain protein [Tepidimonas alkaliphilus]
MTEPRRAAPADEPPPRDAASVVLLRDGAAGLEALLLQRPSASRELGGVFVFPGGKVDAADADPAWQDWLGAAAQLLPARLGEPALTPGQARALLVAAARELREEAGIALDSGAALVPWSRWITPCNPPVGTQRFDTRFFLARLPDGAEVRPDPREVSAALWLTPREALRRAWEGAMALIPPQLMGLAQLARYPSVAAALQDAAARVPPCILPQLFELDGERAMCYPGDPLHPVRERALPGPTRLRLARGRFEPFGGFEEWFA